MNARCLVPVTFPGKGGVGGAPAFVEETRITAPIPAYPDIEPAVLDLEKDGDQDLVIFNSRYVEPGPSGTVYVWRNDDTGRFQDATASALAGGSLTADLTREVEVLDANGDGLTDIFGAQHGYDPESCT
jgi:hypothetical protein